MTVAAITSTGWIFIVLAAVCLFFFVLWVVIEGAVKNAHEKRPRR